MSNDPKSRIALAVAAAFAVIGFCVVLMPGNGVLPAGSSSSPLQQASEPKPDLDSDGALEKLAREEKVVLEQVMIELAENLSRELIAKSPDAPTMDVSVLNPDHFPSADELMRVDPEKLLDHPFFQLVYPEPVRQDPGFRLRFASAVVELRLHKRQLQERLGNLTGEAIEEQIRLGVLPRPKSERRIGELGGMIGGTRPDGTVLSGWMAAPPGSECYKVHEELGLWHPSAIGMLANIPVK